MLQRNVGQGCSALPTSPQHCVARNCNAAPPLAIAATMVELCPFDVRRTFVELPLDFCQTFVRHLLDCCRTIVELLSDFRQTSV